ncbi:MAG: DUF1911 domain-containing protein [Candidatus Azobacteroides sp.]|nr:DUF1911 domain-containing protein [Candidatus Azobacteroides sp.]
MGIINKLFGTSDSKENKPKIRAQYKNERYFIKEINYIDEILKEFEETDKKYIAEHGSLTPFQYLSKCMKYNKKVEYLYCLERNADEMQSVFLHAVDNFSKGWGDDFQGMALLVDMAAKSVLLNISQSEFQRVKDFMCKADQSSIKEMWKPDSLVFFLIGEKEKQRKSAVPAYQKLYEITKLPKSEAEKSIKKYLESWYEMNKHVPWYNNHLRDNGYSGYWAWEVAAVVKLIGLDDSSFKDNQYYPYDLVHWNN